MSVLDVPVIGADRDAVACAGGATARPDAGGDVRRPALRRHRRSPVGRYRVLAEAGVRTVFMALPDLAGPDEVTRCAPIVEAFRGAGS